MMNTVFSSLLSNLPAAKQTAFRARAAIHVVVALAILSLGLAGSAGTAWSNTAGAPINTYPPVYGAGVTVTCGSDCLNCCNCCPPGPPQAWLTGFPGYAALRNWILNTFYNSTVIPAYRSWSHQMAGVIMMEARMIGGFYDGQAHMSATRDLQRLSAEALRDYTPSEAVCQFGTLSKSLAGTDEKARSGQRVMSEITLSRFKGKFGGIGSTGRGQDNADRISNYILNICSQADNDGAMTAMCNTAVVDTRLNHDIDFVRTLAVPETVVADFTDATPTAEESDLITLGHNLYGSQIWLKRMNEDHFKSGTGQSLYQLMRSINAKRSLAENSYNVLVGMKSQGTPAVFNYTDTVLKNLGMSQPDRDAYFTQMTDSGGSAVHGNPSYYAQMDILTKRLYQDPAFYVNLMDKRANVARQQAAMEGLELMQGRDIYTSMSRSEMLLALLVEMEAARLQNKVSNDTTTE